MPIYQADLDHDQPRNHREPELLTVQNTAPPNLRRLSEESLPTDLCEGPIPDSPPDLSSQKSDDDAAGCSNRRELIERLKRGESPTWIPSRRFESILRENSPEPPKSQAPLKPSRTSSGSSGLLPAAEVTPGTEGRKSPADQRLRDGLSIERPSSALHRGDFTQEQAQVKVRAADDAGRQGDRFEELRRNEDAWFATSPPRSYQPFRFDERRTTPSHGHEFQSYGTSPLSSSLSSSFAYQPPTSPLVQSEINEELEGPGPLGGIDFPSSSTRASRRHTFISTSSSPIVSPSPRFAFGSYVNFRRESSAPYQAHQPRRSLTSTPSFLHAGGSPSAAALMRSRRPSLGSDSSPIQHASMVGSYEESILRGRMSTTPSRPLEFTAQIGVLGMGKCKSNLKCPPHVTLPFPAVYYSYSNTSHGRSSTDDGPSPYVGQLDLENGLPNQEEAARSKRKVQSRVLSRTPGDAEPDVRMSNQGSDLEPSGESRRGSRTTKRRSGSPRAPPGGSYRIPEKGQIQIIIKNQNKTAVKLFLVPYDLINMEPGTKTFIRQRSYSTGPIIEGAQSAPQAKSMDRPILRYLVHLHICCPSKGRFYLYKSIRIVFANRVPDGKEKLKNETTWPEPRFTPYKPIRVMHPPVSSSSGPGATLAAEKAFRRRSSGFAFGPSSQNFDTVDDLDFRPQVPATTTRASTSGGGSGTPVEPIPFRLPRAEPGDGEGSDTATDVRSPESQNSRPSTNDSSATIPWGPSRYAKLSKGDLGYGGNAFSPPLGGSPGAEGLLSQRLRSLGVKREEVKGEASHQDDCS